MGLTSAMNTALNGLTLNEVAIDVLGNNIANAGTNGFKSSKVLFTTQLAQTLSFGSRPEGDNGGTNPMQVGLGATTAAILKDFAQGGITSSSSPSDLAIEGDGFFIVEGSEGALYTRDGSFQLDSENKLSTNGGLRVQGFGVVDGTFDIDTDGQIDDLEIDFGLTVAKATQNIVLTGSLSTGEDALAATQGSIFTSIPLYDGTTGPPTTVIPDDTVTLENLEDAGGTSLFSDGDIIRFEPQKGGQTLEAATLAVSTTTSVADLNTFLAETLGIQSGGTIPGTPGVTVNGSGEMVIEGNYGENNDITLISTSLQISTDGGTTFNELSSLGLNKTQSADGESTSTSFVAYDSLGDAVGVKVTAYLESRTGSTTTYRYLIESAEDSDSDIAVANGTITLDGDGQVDTTGGNATTSISIHRANTAADTMDIEVDFSHLLGILSSSEGSNMSLFSQDGSAPGTLTTFNINEAGVINGVFDNGLIRPLGQIVLGRFRNPQGLLDAGTGTFREGVSSGQVEQVTPGSGGAGTIRSGAIELSNTDIGRDLVDLIVTSTNYRGNARVISSVQELVDELLILGR